jgi:DNA-binding NarL/FixJ family response regulator
MPKRSGIEVAHRMQSAHLDRRAVLLRMYAPSLLLLRGNARAADYLPEDNACEAFVTLVHTVVASGAVVTLQ